MQGEAVVRGDVVDRGPGRAQAPPRGQPGRVLPGEHVARARQAGREVPHPADPGLAAAPAGGAIGEPEGAHVVAEGVVPLGEGDGEVPRLPAAGAHVPRLGDELHVPQHGVGDDRAQQRMVGAEAAVVAAERGGEVEAEPVHVHLLHPVAQGGEDQVHRVHGAGVEGAAGAGDVLGDAVVGPVVLEVVQAAQREGGAVAAALGGVVVDHVEDHLEAGRVQAAHHGLDLLEHRLGAGLLGGGGREGGLGGEVRHGRVAPVVRQPQPGQVRLVHRGMDREQLDAGHAKVA